MRRGSVLGVVVACGLLLWLARDPDAARPALRPVPIEAVGERADGHTVDVHVTFSSCQELDRIDVAEDERTVRLTVYVHEVPWCGTVPLTSEVVPAWLNAPVERRTVVDGASGDAVPVG